MFVYFPVAAIPLAAPGPLAARLKRAFPAWRPPVERPAPATTAVVPIPVELRAPAKTVKRRVKRRGWTRRGAAWLAGPTLAMAGVFGTGGNANAAQAASAPASPLLAVVDRHDFQLTVAPVNDAARQAQQADLYVAFAPPDRPRGGWTRVGSCQPYMRDGEPVFLGAVRVPGDGVYFFTSTADLDPDGRPVPPAPAANPQARVLVDTTPPRVTFTSPPGTELRAPGARAVLAWTVEDEALPPDPATLSVSADGGVTWRTVHDALPAVGRAEWVADGTPGTYLFRVRARDLAGHTGEDTVDVVVFAPNPAVPPVSADPAPPAGDEVIEPAAAPAAARRVDDVPAQPAWVEYLRAGAQVRQGRPTDALRHYWLAVDADPEFMEAWMDMALVYKELGRFAPARDALARAEALAAHHPGLLHLRGEISHAEGMLRLSSAPDAAARQAARALIDDAVKHYGQALEAARRQWKLPQMAPTYHRLAEICYYVNHDPEGARLYWRRILDLATPTPDPDAFRPAEFADEAMALDAGDAEAYAAHERRLNLRYTAMKDALDEWQRMARSLIAQLDARSGGNLGRGPRSAAPDHARERAASVYAFLPDRRDDARGAGTFAARGLSGSGSPLMDVASMTAPRAAVPDIPPASTGYYAPLKAEPPRGTWRAAHDQPSEPPVDGRWPEDDAPATPRGFTGDLSEGLTGVAASADRAARMGIPLGPRADDGDEPAFSPPSAATTIPLTPPLSPTPARYRSEHTAARHMVPHGGPWRSDAAEAAPPWFGPAYGHQPGR